MKCKGPNTCELAHAKPKYFNQKGKYFQQHSVLSLFCKIYGKCEKEAYFIQKIISSLEIFQKNYWQYFKTIIENIS